jgi:hypothetical protein
VHVEATGTHLVVARRVDVEEGGRLAGRGVEAEGAPSKVAVVPLLGAVLLFDHAGRLVEVLLRDVALEHVGRLADVIVHADQDQVIGIDHGYPLRGR